LYVGPDNGVLVPAAQTEQILHVYEVTNRSLMRVQVSSTFHGRDIFAPVAAHLASGISPKECGPEISDYISQPYSQPRIGESSAYCAVFHVDSFGNVITNLRTADISSWKLGADQKLQIAIGKKRILARHVRTYSDLRKNEFGLLAGSHGFLEIACREDSAARRVRARSGMAVRISSA
jgi:S-adenosylmethionine hydrolase